MNQENIETWKSTSEKIEAVYSRLARERVLLDLKSFISDTEALFKATAQDVSAETKEIRARVTAALERAKATCTELRQQGAAAGKAAVKRADTVSREHPYQAIGIAFAMGLLIGVPLGRSQCSASLIF